MKRNNEIQFGFINPVTILSKENEKRYDKMIKEAESNKNISKGFSDIKSLMNDLRK